MSSTARPDLPELVEKAVDILGNRVRVAILRSLRAEGPATRKELAIRVGVSPTLMQAHLKILEAHGVVIPDPPRSEPGRLWRKYSVDATAVDGLLDDLTSALKPD